jgi:hypothetical protein
MKMQGARVNIVYYHKKILYPYEDYTITIPLFEDEFKRYGDGGRVDREHLLMALSNVDTIMIKAQLIQTQLSVRLVDVADFIKLGRIDTFVLLLKKMSIFFLKFLSPFSVKQMLFI